MHRQADQALMVLDLIIEEYNGILEELKKSYPDRIEAAYKAITSAKPCFPGHSLLDEIELGGTSLTSEFAQTTTRPSNIEFC
jgi:hypothetical protein